MIWIGFFLATIMAIIQTALFPTIVINSYAPFIALLCMQKSLQKALYLSLLAGLSSDFLSSDPFGIHAFTTLTTYALVHHLHVNFIKDSSLELCFYTAMISIVMKPIQIILLFLFDAHFAIAGKFILLDFIQMPIIDVAYAFFWFVGPLLLWEWGINSWKKWRIIKNG